MQVHVKGHTRKVGSKRVHVAGYTYTTSAHKGKKRSGGKKRSR